MQVEQDVQWIYNSIGKDVEIVDSATFFFVLGCCAFSHVCLSFCKISRTVLISPGKEEYYKRKCTKISNICYVNS